MRNSYDLTDLFALLPQLALQLDRLFDDDKLFELIQGDLARRRP